MKKFFYLIVAAMLFAAGCSESFDDSKIWDKLDNHESRISQLEELCKQMNTNISSLQTIVNALQENDYITNVSPVRKDGEVVGYTITFAHSDTITIYNGTNGEDGYTPQIGVMKDVDDIYYWTIDGEWLLDGKGNKIQAIGENGTNGENGKDAITPRLKIENDYWYVSYDDGKSWEQLGKATGNNGLNGADGDNIFKSVTQDDEYVYFNLADGTMITLPKHDKENIQFEDLQVKAICCKAWDTNSDGELSYAEAAAVTTIGLYFEYNDNIVSFPELRYFTSITNIVFSAFYDCNNLWKIALPNTVEEIGSSAFVGCINLTTITVGENLKTIGRRAFYECENLKAITFPNSIISIGESAFGGCSKLTNIDIPDSVTNLYQAAFAGCDMLKKVTIGSGILSIEDSAFRGCDQLEEVYCKSVTPPTIGSNVFKTSYHSDKESVILGSLKAIYVPIESVDLYKNKYGWSAYASKIVGYNFGNNNVE